MFMNAILLFLYAAACVAYAVQFARRTFDASRVATVLLVLAAFAHTFVIGMETMRVGHVPIRERHRPQSRPSYGCSRFRTSTSSSRRASEPWVSSSCRSSSHCRRFPHSAPSSTNRARYSREPVVRRARVVAALCVRKLCARGRARHHLRAAVQGNQEEGSRFLLRTAAVAQRARRDERARGQDRLAVLDGRADHWRHLGVATALVRRSERVDVDGRSEDLRRGAVLGRVLVRALRAARHRLARPPRGVALGGGFRHRAAEFRAGQLLFHDDATTSACSCFWSASAIAPHRSSSESGSTSRPVVSIAR